MKIEVGVVCTDTGMALSITEWLKLRQLFGFYIATIQS